MVNSVENKEHPTAEVEAAVRAVHAEMLAMEQEHGGEGCPFEELTSEQRHCLERLAAAALSTKESDLRAENERLREALEQQMWNEEAQSLPSSICRERGLVWLEGWFDLRAALQGSAS